ncbi:MAG: P-loop NTPase [Chitinivibrionales bacterium]|nr:P-loop NTPase [Chitinivibrionales bacterium]
MKQPVIISVGGGKGGIGKTVITANIGATLAASGFTVGFIDADFSGANLHGCVGVKRPAIGMHDFLSGRIGELARGAIPTPIHGTWLISGASDIIELANPKIAQRQRLISQIAVQQADYIFIDLGAGASVANSDFFGAFETALIVSDGLPPSLENAYGFIKNGVIRGLSRIFPGETTVSAHLRRFSDFTAKDSLVTMDETLRSLSKSLAPEIVKRLREWLARRKTMLVLNMVRETDDISCGQRFADMVKKYLSINLTYIGYIIFAEQVRQSIRLGTPLMALNVPSKAADCFRAVTRNIVTLTQRK